MKNSLPSRKHEIVGRQIVVHVAERDQHDLVAQVRSDLKGFTASTSTKVEGRDAPEGFPSRGASRYGIICQQKRSFE
jgi:hypothetical protein